MNNLGIRTQFLVKDTDKTIVIWVKYDALKTTKNSKIRQRKRQNLVK